MMQYEVRSEETKSVAAISSLSDLFNAMKPTLLHSAVKHNDLDVIKHLLHSKCDVDAKNSSGATPLLTAVLHNRFDAAKFLLDAGADMLIGNGVNETPLQIVLDERRQTPEHAVRCFIEKLVRDVGIYDEAGEILARADCTLASVLLMEDAQLTRALLNSPAFVDDDYPQKIVNIVLPSVDLENLWVVLQHGSGAAHRRTLYFKHLIHRIKGTQRDWSSVKRHIVQLVKWEIADVAFIEFWTALLDQCNYDLMKLLLECVVHVPSDNKYRQYLVAQAFGTLDYEVIELVLSITTVDANVRGIEGLSALHFAAMSRHVRNLKFLLSKGADPNAKDDRGRVPLFLTDKAECAHLLLQYGADVQSVDNNQQTVFQSERFSFEKLEIVQAHLATLAAEGVPIDPAVYDEVKCSYSYRCYCQQIEKIKGCDLFESVTMFNALVGKPESLLRYVWDREPVKKIEMRCIELGLSIYFRCRLVNNLKEALNKNERLCTIADVMSEITGNPVDRNHLVVVNIGCFL